MGGVAVDHGGVLGEARAGVDRGLHGGGVGRPHQRLGRPQPRPGDGGRSAALVHHGDDGLADPEAGDHLTEVVVGGVGVGVDGLLERLGVVGRVGAQLVLDARAELGEHVVGYVGRGLRHEEDADALRADQPHRLGDLVEEGLGRVVEQQVGLVEEEHQLGLVDVADLGQVVEQVGQQPHQERREDGRPVLEVGQLDEVDQAAAVGRGLEELRRLELRLTEERLGPLVLEADQLAQDDAGGGGGQAAEQLEVGLALVAGQPLHDRAQVGQVEEREALLVGVVEDQAEAGLLGVVEAEHLREQDRPERRHGHPQRDAGALAAEGVELHRERRRRPLLTHRGGTGGDLLPALARRAHAGQVALDVGGEDRHAVGAELLGQQLQGLGLSRARRAGDESVAVEHGERDADLGAGEVGGVPHQAAELEGRALEGVAGSDRVDERVRLGGGLGRRRLRSGHCAETHQALGWRRTSACARTH